MRMIEKLSNNGIGIGENRKNEVRGRKA